MVIICRSGLGCQASPESGYAYLDGHHRQETCCHSKDWHGTSRWGWDPVSDYNVHKVPRYMLPVLQYTYLMTQSTWSSNQWLGCDEQALHCKLPYTRHLAQGSIRIRKCQSIQVLRDLDKQCEFRAHLTWKNVYRKSGQKEPNDAPEEARHRIAQGSAWQCAWPTRVQEYHTRPSRGHQVDCRPLLDFIADYLRLHHTDDGTHSRRPLSL